MRLSLLQKEILLFMYKEKYYDDMQKYAEIRSITATNLVKCRINDQNYDSKRYNNIYEKYRHSLKNLVEKGLLVFDKSFLTYWLSKEGLKITEELTHNILEEKRRKRYIFELVDSIFSK